MYYQTDIEIGSKEVSEEQIEGILNAAKLDDAQIEFSRTLLEKENALQAIDQSGNLSFVRVLQSGGLRLNSLESYLQDEGIPYIQTVEDEYSPVRIYFDGQSESEGILNQDLDGHNVDSSVISEAISMIRSGGDIQELLGYLELHEVKTFSLEPLTVAREGFLPEAGR